MCLNRAATLRVVRGYQPNRYVTVLERPPVSEVRPFGRSTSKDFLCWLPPTRGTHGQLNRSIWTIKGDLFAVAGAGEATEPFVLAASSRQAPHPSRLLSLTSGLDRSPETWLTTGHL